MIDRIAVAGAGRMGRGIALSYAWAGIPATLVDLKPRDAAASEALFATARDEIANDLGLLEQLGLAPAGHAEVVLSRIHFAPLSEAAAGLDAPLIYEGVPEVLEAKRSCFQLLESLVSETAVIASTTSTFLVTDLQEMLVHRERFANAHWLNPAHLMPLVEISRSDQTSQGTVSALRGSLEQIGKVPVVCGPAPGYIVPRIQALAMNEAARMVEEGIASAEDIDKAVRTGFGLRFAVLGLLEFIDWGGGDILYYASRYLSDALGDRYRCPEVVSANMHSGRNGLRDGGGFYDYQSMDTTAYRQQRLTEFVRMLQFRQLVPVADQAIIPTQSS